MSNTKKEANPFHVLKVSARDRDICQAVKIGGSRGQDSGDRSREAEVAAERQLGESSFAPVLRGEGWGEGQAPREERPMRGNNDRISRKYSSYDRNYPSNTQRKKGKEPNTMVIKKTALFGASYATTSNYNFRRAGKSVIKHPPESAAGRSGV